MKATFVCVLMFLFAVPQMPAAPYAKPPHAKRTVKVVIPEVQEIKAASLLIARLRKQFPTSEEVPRLGFDMRVITGPVPLIGYPPEFDPPIKGNYMLTPYALREGAHFLEENANVLDRAERQFITPKKEEALAILDAEGIFGKASLGRYSVAKTFFTLATFKPKTIRRGWAENELSAFIRISEESHGDLFSTKGSRRGAYGLSQFLPSAYLWSAMHYDGTRCVPRTESLVAPNLFNGHDAICSIMNYLHKTNRSGMRMYLAYNHSRSYARSCDKVARAFRKPKALRAAVK